MPLCFYQTNIQKNTSSLIGNSICYDFEYKLIIAPIRHTKLGTFLLLAFSHS
ncbi:hypothetical protein SAMN05421877_102190 [Sphingobacterium lactis]|uniref:Uncharacterized protein n=1 Tax=Sphingobacterium lactis TaxID=797291 RepID=A0A1H5U681_9SPHI|nr:hypothetical protein SAMN05421877_102190 [Sphingobacterium lactis]